MYRNALSSPHKFTLLDTSLPANLDLLKCSLMEQYSSAFFIDKIFINTLNALYNEMITTDFNSIIAKYDAPIEEEDSIEEKIKKLL